MAVKPKPDRGYRATSVKELPQELLDEAFDRCGDLYCVRRALGRAVEFRSNDAGSPIASST